MLRRGLQLGVLQEGKRNFEEKTYSELAARSPQEVKDNYINNLETMKTKFTEMLNEYKDENPNKKPRSR